MNDGMRTRDDKRTTPINHTLASLFDGETLPRLLKSVLGRYPNAEHRYAGGAVHHA